MTSQEFHAIWATIKPEIEKYARVIELLQDSEGGTKTQLEACDAANRITYAAFSTDDPEPLSTDPEGFSETDQCAGWRDELFDKLVKQTSSMPFDEFYRHLSETYNVWWNSMVAKHFNLRDDVEDEGIFLELEFESDDGVFAFVCLESANATVKFSGELATLINEDGDPFDIKLLKPVTF
jgi:hypothetical protein